MDERKDTSTNTAGEEAPRRVKRRPKTEDGVPRQKKRVPVDQEARKRRPVSESEQKVRRRVAEADTEVRKKSAKVRDERQSTARSSAQARRRRPAGEEPRRPEGEPPRRAADVPAEGRKRTARERSGSRVKPKKKKNKALGIFLKIFVLLILIACALGGAFYWTMYGPSKETYDLDTYFHITSDKQLGVTVNNEVLETQAMVDNGEVYLSYELVRDYVNGRFYWDSNENLLLYTLPAEMVRVEVGSSEYTTSTQTNQKDYVILKTDGSTAYIALDFVQEYTNLEYKVYQNPSRVMIVSEWGEVETAVVKRDTQIRLRGGVKSPILEEVAKGDKLTIIEDESDWKKVRTEDGVIGYIQKNKLKNTTKETTSREFKEEEFTSIKKEYTINMAWHQVTSQAANSNVLETLASTKGLTTISPTWFTVADNAGNISSIASPEYVNYAHQQKVEVWALVDNFGEGIDQMALLAHTSVRENLENQLIAEAIQSGIDGINIDFEQISQEAGEHYVQFLREMSVKCRLNNLVLSVDNYVPKGYNAHYNLKEQGVVADYVIIMGYDEHYSGSYEAGSVASYTYVKEGIEETVKAVPADKVINAVPFYTRLWKEVPKTEEELAEETGTEAAKYSTKVTSEALGMAEAATRVSDAGAEAAWDDTTKQNYAEWSNVDGAVYKIWLEDSASLEEKLKLMKENQLAGTAAWKLGFETNDIWELIVKYVN